MGRFELELLLAILTAVALFMFIALLGLCCVFVFRKIIEDMSEEELEAVNKAIVEDREVIL